MKNRQRSRVKAPSQSATPPIQVKSQESRPFALCFDQSFAIAQLIPQHC